MKPISRNRFLLVVLAAMLLMAMSLTARAAEVTGNTYAYITFEEGDLEWDEGCVGELGGMNFNFGTKALPAGYSTYQSTAQSHTLSIKDARQVPADWYVSVSMGKFEDPDDEADPFSGSITLTESVASHDELNVIQTIVIISDGESAPVMDNEEPTRDVFSSTWEGANVVLTITAEEAQIPVADVNYQATLTWMLSATP